MPPTAQTPDSMLLEASFAPAAPGLEPLIVFYPALGLGDLSPGAWRRAEDGLNIPESARRLTIPVGDPASPRTAPTRALTIAEAIPFLIALGNTEVRPSVRAWQLAAHIAQRINDGIMPPRGTETTDASLAKVAAAMPASSRGVLIDLDEGDDELLGAGANRPSANNEEPLFRVLESEEAMHGFLDSAQYSYAVGAAVQAMPRRGISRVLARLTLRLSIPTRREAPWLVQLFVDQDATRDQIERTIDAAVEQFKPLQRWNILQPGEPVELTVDEASALITVAVELQAMGATVELPSELTSGVASHVRARVRLGGSGGSRIASSSPARFRLGDLVNYDLSVALAGRDVDADELRNLARQASALVQVGDDWMALTDSTREQLEKLAQAVESREATMANSHAVAAALAGTAQVVGGITATIERIDDIALDRAITFLREPSKFPRVTEPEGFIGSLRPYQEDGLTWLTGMASLPIGACLADDMGLGKTVQVIALLMHLKNEMEADPDSFERQGDWGEGEDGKPKLRSIVVCPTSVIGNWQREFARFAPDIKVHVHHGPMRAMRLDGWPEDTEVVVTSYGLVARDRSMLSRKPWDVAVFDEAQAVKNPDTEQARAVRSLSAGFRVALTGTPMENRLLELWAIFDLLNPGLLGRASMFSRRFAGPIERGGDEQSAQTLRAITRPFMLRRVKHDPDIVPDLPEKQEQTENCTLTTEQAALYQATVDSAMNDVRSRDGIARRGAVLALLTKLKQICNHPAQALGQSEPIAGRSGKLERLEEMLEEVVAEGDKALVFTQYAQMGSLLASYLPEFCGCEVMYLHGGVPRMQREALVAQFQAETEKPAVFVLSLKAGGLGLNLMQASHVFHYDRWWNPAVEDQATDRTHRIGQTRQIQVHKLVCAGTLEERIAAVIDEKRALAGRIIEVSGSGEGWLTELGNEELEELVSLTSGDLGGVLG